MGQTQGVIYFFVEHFRLGRLPEMNDFSVVAFHSRGDAHLGGQPPPDGRPAVVDSLSSQGDADGV